MVKFYTEQFSDPDKIIQILKNTQSSHHVVIVNILYKFLQGLAFLYFLYMMLYDV
jgi:hypothetical protein